MHKNKFNILQKIGLRLLGKKSFTLDSLPENWREILTPTENISNNLGYISDCIDVYGKAFMKLKFRLYDKGKYNQAKVKEIEKHPVTDLFVNPNPYQTWREILYKMAAHFALYGDVFLYKLKDKSQYKVPRGLTLLFPQFMRIVQNNTVCDWYEYSTVNGIQKILKEDIIHIPYPHPDKIMKGRAIIEGINNIAVVEKLQTLYMKKFYENNGFPGLTFTTSNTLSPENFKRTSQALVDQFKGKSGNVSLLDSDIKPISVAQTMQEMDISKQRGVTRDEILAAFQISKFQLGMGESINRATAIENSMRFYTDVMEPLFDYIDDNLNKQLIAVDFADMPGLYIQHDNMSPRDLDTDLNWYKGLAAVGAITPNEIREFEELEKLDIPEMDSPLALKTGMQLTNDNQNNNNNSNGNNTGN